MPIRLSSAELEKLSRAAELLLSPLDQAGVDQWRSAVNRHLRDLLGADSAGFLLPVADGPLIYSDEHDPEELARLLDGPPPTLEDGTSLRERLIEARVATWRGEGEYGSEHPRDGASGACAALVAVAALEESQPPGLASLLFWRAGEAGTVFGAREVAMLRLLHPAFRAGVEAQQRWERHRTDLLGALDGLGHAVLVCSRAGEVVHQTPALEAALAEDPEGASLRAAMVEAADRLGASVSTPPPGGGAPSDPAGAREIATGRARYRVSPSLYGGGRGGEPLLLVALERVSPVLPTPEELSEVFGLTQAEGRVASLIAQGMANDQIALELRISPHTARRHTERILFKLGARSRAEVAVRLFR